MITITPKDALRSTNMTPGWVFTLIENMYTKPAAGDGSTNYYYELTVVDGPFKGVPLNPLVVNEKAISMHKNFFIACGAPAELWEAAKKGEAQTFDERNPIGKIIKTMVKPEAFDNRMLNKSIDYLALTPDEQSRMAAVMG